MPFLRVNEIQDGMVSITETTAFLPQEILDSNPSTIAIGYPNDLIIAKGGNTLAKVGLLTDQFPYYALSRDLILLRTSEINTYNKYCLWVFLHSKYGQDLLWRTASQTGQPHLTLPSIYEIKLPNFPSDFQNMFEHLYIKSIELKYKSQKLYSEAEELLLEELGLNNFTPSNECIAIKLFSESLETSGRLDAEYYQLKYDDIIGKIKSYKHGYSNLNSQFDIINGTTPKEYISEGIKIIKTKNVRIPLVNIQNIEDCVLEAPMLTKEKDLLFASMGVGSLGRISYVNIVASGMAIDSTLKIFRNKTLSNIEIPTMIFLTSNIGQALIYKYIIGSTGIISISSYDIGRLIIPKFKDEFSNKLSGIVIKSIQLKEESKSLLEQAKREVELAIEQGK